MRKKFATLLTFICLVSSYSMAQAYYEIAPLVSAEVKDRMNRNKIEGIDILTDIEANHSIGISGLHISQKDQLLELLQKEELIKSINLSNDLTKLEVICNASFTNNQLELIIINLNGVIIRHTVLYNVRK